MSTTPTTLQTAQLLLQQLGVSIDDLRQTPAAIPTIAEYLPTVIAASGAGARRTYSSYWNRILTTFGDRRLDQITPSELAGLMRQAMDTPIHRRNTRGGVCAGEHLLAAGTRHLHPRRRRPTHSRPLQPGSPRPQTAPPALRTPRAHQSRTHRHLQRPGQQRKRRRARHDPGPVPHRDRLPLQRRDPPPTRRSRPAVVPGATAREEPRHPLAPRQPHPDDRARRAPRTPRHQHPTAQLLRSRDGTPITTRRHDRLWERIGDQLPWGTAQNIATHWLRHTTITWVERHFSYGIARAYAGHTDTDGASTTAYIRGQVHEIAAALAALTGEPHPLAPSPAQPGDPVEQRGQAHAIR